MFGFKILKYLYRGIKYNLTIFFGSKKSEMTFPQGADAKRTPKSR